MSEYFPRTQDVLEALEKKGLIKSEALAEAAQSLQKDHDSYDQSPWYISMLFGIGAWFSVVFLLVFLSLLGVLSALESGMALVGALLTVLATILRRMAGNIFSCQLALATMLAGEGMIFYGVTRDFKGFDGPALLALVLLVVFYVPFPDRAHRFLATGITCFLWIAYLGETSGRYMLHPIIWSEAFLIGFLSLHPSVPFSLRTMKHTLGLVLPLTILFLLDLNWRGPAVIWPSTIGLGIGLMIFCLWVGKESARFGKTSIAIAGLGALLLGLVSNPGIIGAIGLIVLGFATRDRLLMGSGTIFFPVFLICFYYQLTMTLLAKSLALVLSGVILLAVRMWMTRPVKNPAEQS